MKTLYLECDMGVSGDMLMSALWELVDNKIDAYNSIKNIGIPNVEISFNKTDKCGVCATQASVKCMGIEEGECSFQHNHRTLADVKNIIKKLNVSDSVKERAMALYDMIANAESSVHNTPVSNIHFHEVGTLDAIADIVVCSFLFELINPDRIICSPINVGNGSVKCAHGELPVPAPATALLLSEIPYYKSDIMSELCTPTGAALIKAYSDSFGIMPIMTNTLVGYGAGCKNFQKANVLRAFLGQSDNESIIELSANIDDMTPESLAYACDVLMENGARDVYQTPITMKKSRLGIMLSVICDTEQRDNMLKLIFKHTTTIGVREYTLERATLNRVISKINTPYGQLNNKISKGYETEKQKLEFEDLKQIAKQNDLSLEEVKRLIK